MRNCSRLCRKITAAGLAALLLLAGVQPPPAEAQNCQGWNTEKFFATATVDQVRACLSAGEDLNEQDTQGLTALHRAALRQCPREQRPQRRSGRPAPGVGERAILSTPKKQRSEPQDRCVLRVVLFHMDERVGNCVPSTILRRGVV